MRKTIKKWIKSKKELLRVKLHKEYYKQAKEAIAENNEQFFQALKAFIKSNPEQKAEFIEKVLGEKLVERESFVVGKVFLPFSQWLGDNFKNLVLNPSLKKVIKINVFGDSFIKEYILSKSINDLAIQNATSFSPMEEDKFWAMLYLLLIDLKHGKKFLKYELHKNKVYLFHVKLSSDKIMAIRLYLNNVIEWNLRARDFNYLNGHWNEDNIFLYF